MTTSERYWCDTCQDFFTGSAATIHKGSQCHVVQPKRLSNRQKDAEREAANLRIDELYRSLGMSEAAIKRTRKADDR